VEEKMKKLLVAVIIMATLFTVGCSSAVNNESKDPEQENLTEQSENREPEPTDDSTSLAGIHLGDSAQTVSDVLGDGYKEEKSEDDGFFGEGFVLRQYEGIDVVIGLSSQRVLQIDAYGSQFATNLGGKVGDKANSVLEKYRSKYSEYEGVNSDGKLTGWFQTDEETLVIFSFNEDRSRFNEEVTDDSKVEGITLGYTFFFH
jgi:hypothetical protein